MSNQDIRVKVLFSFIENPEIGMEDEGKRWGEGQIDLLVERIPETPEEWQEISRMIGMNGGYHAVSINKLIPLDQINELAINETIEGEIVDD